MAISLLIVCAIVSFSYCDIIQTTKASDEDILWSLTVHVEAEGNLKDHVVVGEALNASNGKDLLDMPKPPSPQPPYIRIWLVTIIMLATLFALGKHTEVAAVSLSDILLLVLIACTTGGAAIFLYYYGLKRVLASRATIYELSFPIVAIILDYLLHDHIMDFGQWFGTFLLLGAITLLSITRQKVSETDG